MLKVFCVIPAFNEAESIEDVLNQVIPLVDKVVVVDDCSSDKTFDLSLKNGVVVLRHIVNRGQGAALATGTEYAIENGADIIVHFDADGQFYANDIPKIIKPIIEDKADIVFGSRFLEPNNLNNIPYFKRKIIIPIAKIINKLFLKINTTDPQSGFRAFNIKATKKIKWSQDRMAHCSEILYLASHSGLKMIEIPIKVFYKDFGQRFSGGIKIIKELLLGSMLK